MSPVVNLSGEEALLLFSTSFRDRNFSIISEDQYKSLYEKLLYSPVNKYIAHVKALSEQNIRNSVVDYLFRYPTSSLSSSLLSYPIDSPRSFRFSGQLQ